MVRSVFHRLGQNDEFVSVMLSLEEDEVVAIAYIKCINSIDPQPVFYLYTRFYMWSLRGGL